MEGTEMGGGGERERADQGIAERKVAYSLLQVAQKSPDKLQQNSPGLQQAQSTARRGRLHRKRRRRKRFPDIPRTSKYSKEST